MSLISEIAKMLPVVVFTIIVLVLGMILGSINSHHATGASATGLYAVLGIIGERLALVGILNFVVGIGLAVLVAGKLHWGAR